MQSKATTVDAYIKELPEDRAKGVKALRAVILKNLDKGYTEGMNYGMIGYYVPHSIFPAGYHCDPRQPLPFAGLASQKNYLSLYLGGLYCGCDGGEPSEHLKWFQDAWAKSGKRKLDMGKACIRFKSVEDVPLDVIGEAIRRVPLKVYLEYYEKALVIMREQAAQRSAAKKKPGKPAVKAASKASKKTGAARRKA